MYNINSLLELENRMRAVMIRLPLLAGNEIVNFALDNFKRQGFMGDTFVPWKPRKKVKWGKKNRTPNRALLVLTGRLRRSIRITQLTGDGVKVGSAVPYASAHNEGVRTGQIQSVKSFTRRVATVGVIKKRSGKKSSSIAFGRFHQGEATTVKGHRRRINQNIPARPYLKDSPYLHRNLERVFAAEILKGLK